MKKLIYLSVILFILTGCKKELTYEEKGKLEEKTEIIEEKKEEGYVDNNPVKIAFYEWNEGSYRKIYTFKSKLEESKEIGIFSILLSDADEVKGNSRKNLYYELSKNYEDFLNYKIGYSIRFETPNGEIFENILKPKTYNSYSFGEYLYVWLYDDINTIGWHSHIEEDEFNENTIMSSIKLMWGSTASQISSDIELSVFTYDEDDFDELGNYRGKSKFTTIIKRS